MAPRPERTPHALTGSDRPPARGAALAVALAWVAAACTGEIGDAATDDATLDLTSGGLHGAAGEVRPELGCVWDHGDGTYEALFGYDNRAGATERVERGDANRFLLLGGAGLVHDVGVGEQPSLFLPGRHDAIVTVRASVSSLMIWQIGHRFELAHARKRRCDAPPATGRSLFTTATFDGNGRTCATCHGAVTGTISPADVAARSADDPLFRWDGLDDFETGTARIREHATVLVEVPLPPNVRLAADPTATSVVVARGIPSTINTPGLDPVLMLDGRAPDLVAQARDAIVGHAQAPVEPTEGDLALIADFERTEGFFSSPRMADAFFYGKTPELPEGTTDSERRGRTFFVDQPLGADLEGVCAMCHSGPMLNRTNEFLSVVDPGLVAGLRFLDLGINDINAIGNPVHDFIVTTPDGTETTIRSPDLGRALISGALVQVNSFKIPSLWGILPTEPFFHDNSAKDLAAVFDHYDDYFQLFLGRTLTAEQRADAEAYMHLLQ